MCWRPTDPGGCLVPDPRIGIQPGEDSSFMPGAKFEEEVPAISGSMGGGVEKVSRRVSLDRLGLVV